MRLSQAIPWLFDCKPDDITPVSNIEIHRDAALLADRLVVQFFQKHLDRYVMDILWIKRDFFEYLPLDFLCGSLELEEPHLIGGSL